MANGKSIRMADGQLSWEAGIDSGRIPTISSRDFPVGLKRNALAWLTNGTVRGGGISQRTGWKPLVQNTEWPGIFQGSFMYQPDFADPHMILAIGGRIYRIRVDTNNAVEDLTAMFPGTGMPAIEQQFFFAQAEQFLIIQAGDLVTKPLFYFYNATTNVTGLRRSNGFIGPSDPNNEIPPAGPMDYHMNRLWYAFGRRYAAGDIVLNKSSGTAEFQYRDSVLHVTENPVARGGDAFIVPTNAGNIRALDHTTNLDTQLGQSQLYIFSRNTIYAADIPVSRDDWVETTINKLPIQKVAMINGGTYSDRSIVAVNSDLFYQSTPNGDVRSLRVALRDFQQWGNVPLSRNENRVLRFNDRSMLRFSSGIEFDNRLWETVLPIQTARGVAFQGVIPLDFDLISSLEERLPPAWEGMYEGLYHLQLQQADFGGLQRAFSVVVSRETGNIDIWEFTLSDRWDSQVNNDGDRVKWYFESPAYTWGDPLAMKELDNLEIWIDKLLGTVEFELYYRPDSYPCWIFYHAWKECTAKDCREDIDAVDCPEYPVTPYCESFKATMVLPKAPSECISTSSRPSTRGYQFQFRLIIKGWCRIRGLLAYATHVDRPPYEGIVC